MSVFIFAIDAVHTLGFYYLVLRFLRTLRTET